MSDNKFTEPNGARFLLRAIHDEGIEHIFFVPGYMVEPFMSAFEEAGISPVVAAQEGGAAYMADGYSRGSGHFGVALGIGGPGVSNMVNAVAAAYSDRSPVLIVAGNTPNNLEGVGSFQDSGPTGVDDRDLFLPMTVFTEVIPDPTLIGSYVRKAVKAMKGFENRPAFISMPRDMQLTPMDYDYEPVQIVESPRILDTNAASQVPEILGNATHVTILAGNGAVRSGATDAIVEFASKHHVPVVTTARAKGAVPEDHDLSMGVFGVSGSLWGNQVVMGDADSAMPRSDVLLVLGATLNENNTHGWLPEFVPSKALIRVDINPNNVLGKEYNETFITGDVRTFMDWLSANFGVHGDKLKGTRPQRESRVGAIRQTPFFASPEERTSDDVPIKPPRVIAELRKIAPRDTVLVADSGAHTYLSYHHWTSYAPNEFIMLSTTGPMGYGVAVTIGAKIARPDQPHCVIVGDGSLLMHGMEIHTAARYKVPMVIVVINNSALAAVYMRALDESPEGARLAELPTRNWADFAKSLGGDGIVVTDPAQLNAAFTQAFAKTDGPFVVDVHCDPNTPEPNTKEALAP